MATFLDNVTDDQQALELSRYLNKIKSNEENFQQMKKLSEDSTQLETLVKLIAEESSTVFSDANDKEVEGFFFVLLNLAKKLPKESFQNIVLKVLQKVTSAEDKPLFRIRVLTNLYNITGSQYPSERYQVFLNILKYANSTKNNELMVNHLKDMDLDSKSTEWKLDTKQKRELFKLTRDIFASSKSSSKSFKWNLKYISTLGEGNKYTDEDFNEAAKIITEAIRSPDLYQLDSLLNTTVVKGLENHSKHNNSYQLLKIFVNDNLEAYKAFNDKNSKFVESLGLNPEDCLRKMRLLSLATLASENSELPYQLISKSLQINENEVEIWIIMAISENLIAGKMDQMKRTVAISRALQRNFTKTQWKHISDTVTLWKSNVKVMLSTLQESKKLNPNQQHAALVRAVQTQS